MAGTVVYVYDDVALIVSGTVVSAASSEDPLFLKGNVVHPDRARVWRTLTSPGNTTLDIDLGVARPITGFGICNLVSDTSGGPSVDVQSSATSFATVATRASKAAGYWTPGPTVPVRDWVDTIAAQTHRYWRINFTSVPSRFSLGKVILGTGVNLGIWYSPGSQYSVESGANETRTADRLPVSMPFAPRFKILDWQVRATTDANMLALDSIASQTNPIGILDPLGRSYHAKLSDRGQFTHVWLNQWDVRIPYEQMP